MNRIAFFLIGSVVLAALPTGASAQTVMVNGRQLMLNPGAISRAGRVFVPLRSIFERLGASVVYSSGTINATKGSTAISLQIGSTQATVSGQPQVLDVAPFVVGATTYVPLRFVAQSFGAAVGFDNATNVVTITYAGNVAPVAPERPPAPMPPARIVNLTARQPGSGESVQNRYPTISATFTYRVDPASVRVWLDGAGVTGRSTINPGRFSFQPPSALANGSHTVRVAGRSTNGSGFDRSWSFSVYGEANNPILLSGIQPVPGSLVKDRFKVIAAQFSRNVDPSSVRVWLDGANRTRQCRISAGSFSYAPPAPYDYGPHTIRVSGMGPQGGSPFDRSWTFPVVR